MPNQWDARKKETNTGKSASPLPRQEAFDHAWDVSWLVIPVYFGCRNYEVAVDRLDVQDHIAPLSISAQKSCSRA